jgi:transcriptional regulator with XRE-family HTH domain
MVAAQIKSRRVAAGLTQQRAAVAADIAVAMWSRYERGSTEPGLRTLARIARALGCEPADLMRGEP